MSNYRRRFYETESEESSIEEKEIPKTRKGVIANAPLVNIRAEANPLSSIVAVLKEGESVTIVGEENGYYKVHIAGAKDKNAVYNILKTYCKEV